MDIVVSALTLGTIYGLVGMSFNVMYRPTNVFNFAQGALVMVGAMLAATLGGLPWIAVAAIAALVAGTLGVLTERLAVTPILRRTGTAEGWIVSTLAVSLILDNVAGKIWDSTPRAVAPPAPLSMDANEILGVPISSYQIGVVVLGLIVGLTAERFYRTRQGRAVLAVAEDREAAQMRGISPSALAAGSWALGGAFAGLVGVLAGPILYASIALGPSLLVMGFAAAALGGIGNLTGALIAGYLVGLVEALTAAHASPGLQPLAIFVLATVVLLARPTGLIGRGVGRTV